MTADNMLTREELKKGCDAKFAPYPDILGALDGPRQILEPLHQVRARFVDAALDADRVCATGDSLRMMCTMESAKVWQLCMRVTMLLQHTAGCKRQALLIAGGEKEPCMAAKSHLQAVVDDIPCKYCGCGGAVTGRVIRPARHLQRRYKGSIVT